MKVLKENTMVMEELPISFITDYISKGWEEVGYLKEASSAILAEYSNTDKIEQSMQDLMDAYLIFIGQMEAYLQEKENIATDDAPADIAAVKDEPKHELPEADIEIEPIVDAPEEVSAEVEPAEIEEVEEPKMAKVDASASDPFEFFVDFEEPDLTEPGISDEELYGEEDSEQAYNKLRSQLKD
jgi:hypothetical protein